MKIRLSGLFFLIPFALIPFAVFAQRQTCPVNVNFSSSDLTHWYAYTGNNHDGNGESAIMQRYDSTQRAPAGTIGAKTISEYEVPSRDGIAIVTGNFRDVFGNFPSIPVVNGYHYNYSIQLGSTAVARGTSNGQQGYLGGYIRGIRYKIAVPAGPASEPYTMTYAYALVLENGTHNTNQQPFFSATLSTGDSVITCASRQYTLPTYNNAYNQGQGATLDSMAAIRNGFHPSLVASPNPQPNNRGGVDYRTDVWYKGWNEVTFDLAPYRGKTVTLAFESDNCIPGGHFAYAYLAIRNECAGLQISGDSVACFNSDELYSIPALAGASYEWVVSPGWSVVSSADTNFVTVKSGTHDGYVVAREVNGCANLSDTLALKVVPPPEGGKAVADTEVCAGINSVTLHDRDYSGTVIDWLASEDLRTWTSLGQKSDSVTAENLEKTTWYRAVVSNGGICPADTGAQARIKADPHSDAGHIFPGDSTICTGQNPDIVISDRQKVGGIVNWQSADPGGGWTDFDPARHWTADTVVVTQTKQYRTIVKNGVCPADTSDPITLTLNPALYPQASVTPADTTICYGGTAQFDAAITLGTTYQWIAGTPLTTPLEGDVGHGYQTHQAVSPDSSTQYTLLVKNEGCPNTRAETAQVHVSPPILVSAGPDTSVLIGQPVPLFAASNDPTATTIAWMPAYFLDRDNIANPVATMPSEASGIVYTVRFTNPAGCSGEGKATVKVFHTKPDIFVPNAFTPGGAVNTIFRPIPVGIVSLNYFRVYNRNGRLMYATTRMGDGWDGMLAGTPQDSGGYVWMVAGTDIFGQKVEKKGVMVLIR